MSKEFKTSLHINESGLPDTDTLVSRVWEWSKGAQSGKWVVHIFQDLTREQRGYLHSALIPHYVKVQNDLGSVVSPESAKNDLKKRFLGYQETVFSDKNGEKHRVRELRHTESLTKEQYSEFIETFLESILQQP